LHGDSWDVISADDLIVDTVLKLPELPKPEGVHIVTEMDRQAGGACNFLIVASRLGLRTMAIGCVGDDENGRFLIQELESEGVSVVGIKVKKSSSTKSSLVLVDSQGNKSFVGILGRGVAILRPEDVDLARLSSQALYFSGYSLARLPVQWEAEAVLKVFGFCLGRMKIFFDPGPLVPLLSKETLDKTISSSDLLLLNSDEAKMITGLSSIHEMANAILNMGAKTIVIKRGEQGSLVRNKESSRDTPSFKVNVVDPTGAGDAFNAGFIFGYLKGWDLSDAALLANAVGALSITKLGAGSQLPKRDEVIRFLQENYVKIGLS
jgi:sugar/nucleoside kinase (ribokinase family)